MLSRRLRSHASASRRRRPVTSYQTRTTTTPSRIRCCPEPFRRTLNPVLAIPLCAASPSSLSGPRSIRVRSILRSFPGRVAFVVRRDLDGERVRAVVGLHCSSPRWEPGLVPSCPLRDQHGFPRGEKRSGRRPRTRPKQGACPGFLARPAPPVSPCGLQADDGRRPRSARRRPNLLGTCLSPRTMYRGDVSGDERLIDRARIDGGSENAAGEGTGAAQPRLRWSGTHWYRASRKACRCPRLMRADTARTRSYRRSSTDGVAMDARRGLEGDSLARRIVLLIRNAADSASLVDWRVHAYRKSLQMLTMRSTPLGFIWATSGTMLPSSGPRRVPQRALCRTCLQNTSVT